MRGVMPTVFAHAAVGWSLAQIWPKARAERWLPPVAAVLAAVPDADVLLMRAGFHDGLLSHRALTHSITFAISGGLIATAALRRRIAPTLGSASLFGLITVAIGSHGLLDAFTDGGAGIAFFAPFSTARYFMPWHPIPVAPLSAAAMVSRRGLELLGFETALFGPFVAAAAIGGTARRVTLAVAVLLAVGLAIWVAMSTVEPTRLRAVS